MREIKFRAWWNGQMVVPTAILPTGIPLQFVPETNGLLEMKGAILLQYTGVKDKNGKEIYEGDIVRGVDGLDHIPGKSLECHYENHVVKCGDVIDDWRWGQYGTLDSCLNFSYPKMEEVIGNIYENPELLGRPPKAEASTDKQASRAETQGS